MELWLQTKNSAENSADIHFGFSPADKTGFGRSPMNSIPRRLSKFARSFGSFFLAGLALGFFSIATAADTPVATSEPKTSLAQQERIQSLVDQLGSENFQDREQAEKQLAEAGLAAIPSVRAATQSDDPEIASRATRVMKELDKLVQKQRTQAIRKNILWHKTFDEKPVKKVTALSTSGSLLAYGLNGWGVEWMNTSTGKLAGSSFFGANVQLQKPVIADGKIFVGSGEPNLIRVFDAKAGKLLWSAKLDMASSRPAVANGHVYVIEANPRNFNWARLQIRQAGPGAKQVVKLSSKLVAFDANTGKRLWETNLDKVLVGHPAATDDGRVVALRANGHLVVVDTKTGKIQSQIKLGKQIGNSSPVIDQGIAFVQTTSSVVAVDLSTGKIKWNYATVGNAKPLAGRIVVRQIMIANGRVVQLGTSGTGSGTEAASPAIGNGKLYFSSASKVYALDATTGHLQWQATIESKTKKDDKKANNGNVAVARIRINGVNMNTLGLALTQPSIANNMVMVGSPDGLYGLDAKTGKQLWMFETKGVVQHRAAISQGVAYFGVNHGQAEMAKQQVILRRKGVAAPPHIAVKPSIYSVKLTPVDP
jgi:outer membrane protein assembly factor BamB